MKIIIGVDLAGRYIPALDLCMKLAFPEQSLTFVHSVVVFPEFAPPFSGAAMSSQLWMRHLREAGQESLTKAVKLVGELTPHSTKLKDGAAAYTIMYTADELASDLIVVGSAPRGRFEAFFGGSVARALTIGAQQSILVTKGESSPSMPLKAIFATDHSLYAARALEQLCRWNPKGIERIDVLTAHDDDDEFMASVKLNTTDSNEDSGRWLTDHLSRSTEKASERLREMGYQSNAIVLEGHPSTLIGEQMKAREADLLILGAQGHGFLERLLVGSVSLYQVVSEPYPVLLIRA